VGGGVTVFGNDDTALPPFPAHAETESVPAVGYGSRRVSTAAGIRLSTGASASGDDIEDPMDAVFRLLRGRAVQVKTVCKPY
jgi:hypothetical protein